MSNRVKVFQISQYDVSNISETNNNRLVDLADSFIALLTTDIPEYRIGNEAGNIRTDTAKGFWRAANVKSRSPVSTD